MNYQELLNAGFMPVPHTTKPGDIPVTYSSDYFSTSTSGLLDVDEDNDFDAEEQYTENISNDVIKMSIKEDVKYDIPSECFLLSSGAGEVILKPDGFSEKEEFLVLFFPSEAHLVFRPTIGARFIGACNLPSGEQSVYHLLYSGINFKLPDSERVCVIFHRVSLD